MFQLMTRQLNFPLTKGFTCTEEMAARIEEYRRRRERIPTESVAIRELVELGLSAAEKAYANSKPTSKKPRAK